MTAYRRNPSVLFAHDSSSPPIGRTVNIWSDGTRLLGDIEFAPPEVYEFADTVYRLVTGGFLKSGSVGFLPITYKFSDDDDRPYGIDFQTQELLEFSVTPVPANPHALIEAQAKGIVSASQFRRLHSTIRRSPAQAIPTPEPLALKAKAARARRVFALKARINAPASAAIEEAVPLTIAAAAKRVAQLRAEHGLRRDPRLVVANATFRLQR